MTALFRDAPVAFPRTAPGRVSGRERRRRLVPAV